MEWRYGPNAKGSHLFFENWTHAACGVEVDAVTEVVFTAHRIPANACDLCHAAYALETSQAGRLVNQACGIPYVAASEETKKLASYVSDVLTTLSNGMRDATRRLDAIYKHAADPISHNGDGISHNPDPQAGG